MNKFSLTVLYITATFSFARVSAQNSEPSGKGLSGTTIGYLKAGQQIYTKDLIHRSCTALSTSAIGSPAEDSVGIHQVGNRCVLIVNNTDSIMKRYSFNVQSGSGNLNVVYQQLSEKTCNVCLLPTTTGNQVLNETLFLQYLNEYRRESPILSAVLSPFINMMDSNISDFTIYHGVSNIFGSKLIFSLKNVAYGAGVPHLINSLPTIPYSQVGHLYSRIYRFDDYEQISSPDPVNKAVIGGLVNQKVSWHPGYTDKEHDSIHVTPFLMYVSDTIWHPIMNMGGCHFSASPFVDSAHRANILSKLVTNTVPIQYNTGYDPANPFGTNSIYTLNEKTGEIGFTPSDTGIYFLAYRVSEYRNNQLLGDFMNLRVALIRDSNAVLPIVSDPFSITGTANYNATSKTFTVCAGQTVSYKVKATSTLSNSMIVARTNALMAAPGASVSIAGQDTDSATMTFTWTPTDSDAGHYYIYLDAQDTMCAPNHMPIHKSTGVTIIVRGAAIQVQDSIICQGDTTRLQSYSSGGNSWAVLPGGDPYLPCVSCESIDVHPAVSTSYVLTTTANGCVKKDTFTIRVVPNFTVNAGNDTSFGGPIPLSYELNVTVVPPISFYTYQWQPINNVDSFWIKSPKPVNATNINQYIVVVSDSLVCFTQTDTIIVKQNNVGVADVERDKEAIHVYPNPNEGSFTLKAASDGRLTITTLEGRLVKTLKVKKGQTELTLPAGTAQGVYQLIFEADGDGQRQVMKLMYRD